jgi:glycosyltransferase involved in cell wall biosynthesis
VDLQAYKPCTIYKNLLATEVAEVLNRCRVGLILSEEEGICSASCDYLLCGLPVVSTPSRGGRDEFYDSENCIIVEPSSTAVAEAVAEWLRRLHLDCSLRSRIRASTIARVELFRQTFISVLREAVGSLGGDEPIAREIAAVIGSASKIRSHRNSFVTSL